MAGARDLSDEKGLKGPKGRGSRFPCGRSACKLPILHATPTIAYPPELPISARREEIVATLRSHRVVIVAGETGSGKTTQLPKMCLEAGLDRRGRIGCTQPRRVAAMSVSRRVAEELGVAWGREVGCKMRFNDDTSRDTRIKFMTDGILLAEIQSDPMLRAYSALILDEAHERSLNIDFLLGYLQGLLKRRPDFRLIVTSATIDTEAFSAAFDNAPIIQVSGRLYPVDIRYAPIGSPSFASNDNPDDAPAQTMGDDVSFVEAAARAVEDALIETDSGDVLVFMPTERDIREAREILEGSLGPGIDVLALFGRMPAAEQQRIFSPGERRRVVIATNVAETSLTIPRIGVVIDTGLARMSRYNPRTRTKRLPVEPISQSSANQRAGRAGRVRDGVCIRLYSQEDFDKRPQFTQPEIQRANLAEVILRMKAFGLGEIETFPFLNPPAPQAIRAGYRLLEELGALLEAEDSGGGEAYVLTGLGNELARLPVDPTLGRMLLQATTENALPEILVIAAGLSIPDPRERPDEEKEAAAAAHKVFVDPASDFVTLLNIWNAAPPLEGGAVRNTRNALRRFCKANYLSLTRMREWRDVFRQLSETMEGMANRGLRNPKSAENRHLRKEKDGDALRNSAIHRSVLAGLLGQVGQREERNLYKASSSRVVALFPGSGLYERNLKKSKAQPVGGKPRLAAAPSQPQWIVAGEIVQTSQLFARTVAAVDPQWIIELGAHLCKFSYVHPQWSAKAGRVLVWERALIYGLELSKRQIDYGRVNPVEATELFIRGALIAREETARINHRFFSENDRLRDRIENALTKVRNNRVHDLDAAFYEFYAARIEKVSSIQDLDKLVRARIAAEPAFLCATEADIMGNDDGDLVYDRHAFPDQVSLGNTVIPLSYAYNPGEEEDGVTVRIPLPLAERLSTGQLQWMVPGLREEQVGSLLRALPKAIRKQLMPLEPKIREILAEFHPGDGDLLTALSGFIERKYRVAVRPEDWRALPDYLQPRVEVIDGRNRTVTTGRDLNAVRASMETQGVQSDAWERAVRSWEKPDITCWSVGDLPESIIVQQVGGMPLLAYPGLAVRQEDGGHGGEVDLRLFRRREEAEAASHSGVRRLAEIVLARDIAWLLKELRTLGRSQPAKPAPGMQSLGDALNNLSGKLQTIPSVESRSSITSSRSPNSFSIGTPSREHPPITGIKSLPKTDLSPAQNLDDILAESACRHIAKHAFRLEPLHPLTASRFQSMIDSARRELPVHARRVRELTAQVFILRDAILSSPKRYAGLEQDIQRLVPPDFLEQTPHAQLAHLPRYLRAIQIRAERASVSPSAQAKDTEKARQLTPFLRGGDCEKIIHAANRESFRWMLEEFRVSLFAQELGTAQPVSAQRLRTLGGE